MRAGRLFLVLSVLTGAGIAAARPDVVLPIAQHYFKYVLAEATSAVAVAEPVATAQAPLSSTSAPTTNETTPPTAPKDTQLPSFVPGAAALKFNASEQPQAPEQLPPDERNSAALPAEPTALLVPSAARDDDAASPTSTPSAPAALNGERPATPITLSVEPIPPRDPPPTDAGSGSPETVPAVVPAKSLFGAATTAAPLSARAIGSYSRGCLAGAVALPVDGPAWQAMRLSRNRNWGHPKLISMVEKLAIDAQKHDDWPGLLVGDISQPRGGPMLTGHASHQIGLDADVWLTPMPTKRLTRKEREEISATSMLDQTDLAVDAKVFTPKHVALIKRAASYPEVERVLVHPAIKKALCEAAGSDRKWLGKVRPIGGHYYHFHIRIGCPPGSTICKPQVATTGDDGCAKEVDEWLARLAPAKEPPPPKPPGYKPPPPPAPITMAQLPAECTAVLESGPDGVRQPLKTIKDDFPMGGMGEAKTGAFVAGSALRPHIMRLKAAEQSKK